MYCVQPSCSSLCTVHESGPFSFMRGSLSSLCTCDLPLLQLLLQFTHPACACLSELSRIVSSPMQLSQPAGGHNSERARHLFGSLESSHHGAGSLEERHIILRVHHLLQLRQHLRCRLSSSCKFSGAIRSPALAADLMG